MNADPANTRGSISSRRSIAAVTTFALACLFAAASARAQNAYITNEGEDEASNTVSVIDTATNQVVGSPITVGANPLGVAVTPDGSNVYVTNTSPNTVSVIDTATNQVVGSPI